MRANTRYAVAAALVLSLTACGDSTSPNANLNDEQIADMMNALASAGVTGFTPLPAGNLAVVTFNESVECPNGGTLSFNATIDENESTGAFSASVTQGFANCKSTSSAGRLWTFNGDPNITTTLTGTSNASTGAFSMSGTQTGGITFSSNLGTGACAFDVTFSMSGNENTEQFTGSMTGTVCGRSVSQSLSTS